MFNGLNPVYSWLKPILTTMLKTFDLAGHVIGIMIEKDLDSKVLDDVKNEIKERLATYHKVNLYVELKEGYEVSLKALFKGIKFKYSHEEYFGKIAIVTNEIWFQNAVNVSDVFLDAPVRTYMLKDRLEAIQWISI